MTHCEFETGRTRVVFGAGRARDLAGEVERLGVSRLLAVVDVPGDTIGGLPIVATLDEVRAHVPIELAQAARSHAATVGADGLIAVGGGSAIGLAKAVALTSGLPIIAVPTTYAGSEMTPIWGITEDARKTTGTDFAVLPRLVVYDPELQLTLPPAISAASGVNALAHAVEALWAPRANPISSAVAEESIGVLAAGLESVVAEPDDLHVRTRMLRGAWLAGASLAGAGTAIHHGLCHLLGGAFDLPHAELHAVMLPHVVALIAPDAPDALGRMARALEDDDPVLELDRVIRSLGLPASLAELGLNETQLSEAIRLAGAKELPAPQPLDEQSLSGLLRRAFEGARASGRVV